MGVRLLLIFSIGYLLIPNLLFYFYWTRSAIAIIGIILLLCAFAIQQTDKNFPSEDTLSVRNWATIGVVALFITLFSGTAGICYQSFDHWGHNTKFNELFQQQWPIRYPKNGPPYSYYFGFFLVPALFSKMIGDISEFTIFVWTHAGISLGIAWLYLVLHKKMLYVLLCLSIGDTPTVIMKVAKRLGIEISLYYGDVPLKMFTLSNRILYVPNQIIPILILGGMLVYLLKSKANIENMVFPIALSLWWAVFPAMAYGLITGILILRKWIQGRFRENLLYKLSMVVLPVLTCTPVLLLYESHQEIPVSGFLWKFVSGIDNLLNYLLEIVLDLLLFLLVYRQISRQTSDLPSFPFYLILTFMLTIPAYRLGLFNEFLLYSLLPCVLLVGIYLLRPLSAQESYLAIVQISRKSFVNFVLLALLFSSSYTTWLLVKNTMRVNVVTTRLFPGKFTTFKPYPYDDYSTIYEFLKTECSLIEANQYRGREESFYQKYIGLNAR